VRSLNFDVNAIACGGCTGGVQRALGQVDSVGRAAVTLPLGMAIGVIDPARITPVPTESVAVQLGHPAKVRHEKEISRPLGVRLDAARATDRDAASGVAA
jgi:copper chaperone CopZ